MIRAAPIRTALFASAVVLAACSPPAPAQAPADAPAEAAPPPAAAPAEVAPPEGLETALRGLVPDGGELSYAFAPVDLDGDGAEEVLAYVMGPMVCGSGGCNLYVLAAENGAWRLVTRTTVTRTPIGVLETSTNGWRDLAVSVSGGGAGSGWARLPFDGRRYASNPTVAPAEPLDGQPEVTILIAAEPDRRPLP